MTQKHLPVKVLYIKKLIVINQEISYWPSYRSEVSCICLRLCELLCV